MSTPWRRRRWHPPAAVVGVAGLVLTGCSVPSSTSAGQDVAITHIHAAQRDPGSGDLLLATHQGLFRLDDGALRPVGPVMDLMGFTIDSDGTYLASGHPGPQSDLPEPLGLITSEDRGATWTVASRGGQSDFHSLTSSGATLTGFDGTLRSTRDRTTWQERPIPSPPRVLAASPDGTLLATTAAGLLRSQDDGATWATLTPPRPVVLVAWADQSTVVAVTAEGTIATSTDSGESWTLGATALGEVTSLSAGRTPEGALEVITVIEDTVVATLDQGRTIKVLVQ
ncbi:F510_1955 family glycosylhydrolase [Ornithinimicrobium sp. W1665]|uniref:F510_1955 family glycosylhydrolase n=1 Tax=Ornithinimicrobium sp. W1665 TaxID=3416666 RepID=UPI003CF8B292